MEEPTFCQVETVGISSVRDIKRTITPGDQAHPLPDGNRKNHVSEGQQTNKL